MRVCCNFFSDRLLPPAHSVAQSLTFTRRKSWKKERFSSQSSYTNRQKSPSPMVRQPALEFGRTLVVLSGKFLEGGEEKKISMVEEGWMHAFVLDDSSCRVVWSANMFTIFLLGNISSFVFYLVCYLISTVCHPITVGSG